MTDCRRAAEECVQVEYNEVRACGNSGVTLRPETLDVVVMPAGLDDSAVQYATMLAGGLEFAVASSLGEQYTIFEPAQDFDESGTSPVCNPTALMRSAVLMLEHLGENKAARKLEYALSEVYADGKCLTPDAGGTASIGRFTTAVLGKLRKALSCGIG